MKTIDITSMEELIHSLNSLPNCYIYRGQADSAWPLASSLERVLSDKWSADNAAKFERYGLEVFKSNFHLYDHENICPETQLAWLAMMQHYGAPTRLIDFTSSPFVALYFAIETARFRDAASASRYLSIYAFNYTELMEASLRHIKTKDSAFTLSRLDLQGKQDSVYEQIIDRFCYDIAWVTEPTRINKRIDRQAGCFLLSGNRGLRIEQVLKSQIYESATLLKYDIPYPLIESIWALLRKMNINSKTIYGDLHGLCNSLRIEFQVYS